MQSCVRCTALSWNNPLVSRSGVKLHLPLKILCELPAYFTHTQLYSHLLSSHLYSPNGTIWNHFIAVHGCNKWFVFWAADSISNRFPLSHAFMSLSSTFFLSFCMSDCFTFILSFVAVLNTKAVLSAVGVEHCQICIYCTRLLENGLEMLPAWSSKIN